MAYELIETVEVGAGGSSSIEFTSIPQDGTDLKIVLSARINVAAQNRNLFVVFNNTTGSSYKSIRLTGSGSSVVSESTSNTSFTIINQALQGNLTTANSFGNVEYYISNYTSSEHKSGSLDGVTENNGTDGKQMLIAGSWDDTSAISSVSFASNDSADFVTGSSISLYKITAA